MITLVIVFLILITITLSLPAYLSVMFLKNITNWDLMQKCTVGGVIFTFLYASAQMNVYTFRKRYALFLWHKDLIRFKDRHMGRNVYHEEAFITYDKSSRKHELARILSEAHALQEKSEEHFRLPNRICCERYVSVYSLTAHESDRENPFYYQAIKDLSRYFVKLQVDRVISFKSLINVNRLGPCFARFVCRRKDNIFLYVSEGDKECELVLDAKSKSLLQGHQRIVIFESNLVDTTLLVHMVQFLKRECPSLDIVGIAVLFDHTESPPRARLKIPKFKAKVVRLIGIKSGINCPSCTDKIHVYPDNIQADFAKY